MHKGKMLIAGIGVVLAIFLIGLLGRWESHYTRDGYVTEIQPGGVAVIEDYTGNIWEIQTEEFHVGDDVRMTFFNSSSAVIADAVIDKIELKR